MYVYLIEQRRTVGSYKTIAATYTEQNALAIFEEAKKNNGFGQGRPEIHKDGDKKDPSILKYAKVGSSHDNTILRIRMDKVVE
jgi:hypothetical protein